MSIQRRSHVGICAAERERPLRVGRDGLGLCMEGELRVEGLPDDSRPSLEKTRLHAVHRARDGVRVELFQSPGSADGPPPPGGTSR